MKNIEILNGKSFLTCSACMTVWADALSYANANTDKVTMDIEKSDNVIILSCQVTDLAILNDIRIAENYKNKYPDKKFYISGCLGERLDIELPRFLNRLKTPRAPYRFIFNKKLVNFEKPFWIRNYKSSINNDTPGNLFRNMYPLRIGKGCPMKCTYCNIRKVRGSFETYDTNLLEDEFITFDNILLVADAPTSKQIKEWCKMAIKHKKPFSIRNVEPNVSIDCEEEFIDLSDRGLLKYFHSPIQSYSRRVLEDMNRSCSKTFRTIEMAINLKDRGTQIATNIIIDYKDFEQEFDFINEVYDFVNWNPYWDGIWDREKAEDRFEKYI